MSRLSVVFRMTVCLCLYLRACMYMHICIYVCVEVVRPPGRLVPVIFVPGSSFCHIGCCLKYHVIVNCDMSIVDYTLSVRLNLLLTQQTKYWCEICIYSPFYRECVVRTSETLSGGLFPNKDVFYWYMNSHCMWYDDIWLMRSWELHKDKTRARLGRVAPLGRPRSVYKSNIESKWWPNDLEDQGQ